MAYWIIVADDDMMNLKMAGNILSKAGMRVTAVKSGKALIDYLNKNEDKPQLILLDIKMPVMDGFETYEKLKASWTSPEDEIPVIFLTADDSEDAKEKADKMGASCVVRKPFEPPVLISKIKATLEGGEEPEEVDTTDYVAERKKLPHGLLEDSSIDVDEGIRNNACAEDYLKAINIFLDNMDDNMNHLKEYFAAEDIDNYTVKVHSLKSTSRIIGAMGLSAKAAALEKAGLEKDIEYIKANHEILMDEYRAYGRLISEDVREDTPKKELSQSKRDDMYMTLTEYANSEDYSLVEMILDSLADYELDKEDEERIVRVKKALHRLDWDALRAVLRDIV